MRILVTGSRNWQSSDTVRSVLDCYLAVLPEDEVLTIIHGACPTGADQMAHDWVGDWCQQGHFYVSAEPWPAHWDVHGKAAGPIRNQNMVTHAKPDVCLAFIRDDSRGATDCASRAVKAHVLVRYFRESKLGEFIGES